MSDVGTTPWQAPDERPPASTAIHDAGSAVSHMMGCPPIMTRWIGPVWAFLCIATLFVSAQGCAQVNQAPVLEPGSGWTGPTAQPSPIGSGPGVDAKAIARWDVVPYQTFDGIFGIGVVAFHINHIDRVEFSVENGPWTAVKHMTLNPRTGVIEYWVRLDAHKFNDGPIEVRAIAYPKTGIPRVLGRYPIDTSPTYDASEAIPWRTGEYGLQLVANAGGTFGGTNIYVSPVGSDDIGDGSPDAPYRTVAFAVDQLRNENHVDGGVVYLQAGQYDTIGLNRIPEDLTTWLTIAGAPGLKPEDVTVHGFSSRTQAELLRIKGMTFSLAEGYNSTLFYGGLSGGSRYIWLDNVEVKGESRTNRVPIVRDREAFFATQVRLENNTRGFGGELLRDITMLHLGDDAFTDGQLVVNCWVADIDKYASENPSAHADVYQIYDPDGIKENSIVYGVQATDGILSQGFFGGTPVHDVAFINIDVKQLPGPHHPFTFGETNNMYVKDSSFLGQSSGKFTILDATRVKNVVLENSVFSALPPHLPTNWMQPGIRIRPPKRASMVE